MSRARYEGFAEWYDETFARYGRGEASSAAHLQRLLGEGKGWCLDIGCGTGIHFEAIIATGRKVIGVDISAGQLRVAKRRVPTLVVADAARLPFADGSFDAVTSTFLHTDVDDMAPVFQEAIRVLRPGGRLVYVGTHPCFIGHFIERRDERTKIVHPGYRDPGWHFDSPYFGEAGVRRRVGFRHVPLAELIGALLASGLRLTGIEEPAGEHPPASEIPGILVLCATKDAKR